MEDIKRKFIGFRLSYLNYLRIIHSAQQAGVSISDFIISNLLPLIDKNEIKIDSGDFNKLSTHEKVKDYSVNDSLTLPEIKIKGKSKEDATSKRMLLESEQILNEISTKKQA